MRSRAIRSTAYASVGARRAWDDEPAWVSDGVSVQRGCLLLVPHRAGGGVGGRRWRTTGWPADKGRLSNTGGESSPALSASSASVLHGDDEATGRGATEGKLRRIPTWRAKCWITGSGKTLKVRTLGCARRSPPTDPRPSFAKISRTNSTNSQHKGHKIYTGSGHHCGVIPYSSVVVVDCLSS